jgi:hypothetical protein
VPSRTTAYLALPCLLLAALACNLSPSAQGEAPLSPSEMTLAEALEVPPQDRRPEVLRLMGLPDSITITWQQLEGQEVRLEEWSYFDSQTRFDFVDGELAWTIDIDPAPDGTLFAHQYDPLDFDSTMTVEDAKTMLAGQELVEESLAGAEAPGGLALIGDQILLGFDGERLTFVQTFVLSPDGQAAAGLPAEGAQGAPTTEPVTAAGAPALLEDGFEGASPARALFGQEHMTFDEQSGEGILTSLSAGGVVPIVYDQPLLSDFALEVDVRFAQAQPGSAAGVIFRSDAAAGGLDFYYHFSFQPAAGQVKLEVWKDGHWSTLTSSPIPVGVVVAGAIDRLRVEADGDDLRLFVNGTRLLDASDTSLTAPGIIGLSLIADATPATVYFDNLRIEALDE